MFKSYRDLEVWREAMDLVEAVYAATVRFPADERFGLTVQLRRAAVSVASELETQLQIAYRLSFSDGPAIERLMGDSDRIGRMLRGLMKSLDARLLPVSSP